MYCNGGNQLILGLTKQRIVRLGLVSLCVATFSVIPVGSVKAVDEQPTTKASTEIPIVKSAALGTDLNVPWSRPVRIQDPFEGEYVGIFDRHQFYKRLLNTNAKVDVVSLWSRDSVRFLLAYRDRDCLSSKSFYKTIVTNDCVVSNAALKVTNLYLKIEDKIFRLEGKNSTFSVNNELANALKNSPPKNVNIRLVAESGETIDSEIGKGTVKAWKEIY
ncbi:MAG: hypothetical protein KME21_17705 [Desmonostoc vinosum HA7617-LM4]|nr:hypothetical protein [Desmonostoc vinosum HA7617-LM4]